jgi:hypothetical protein
MHHTCTIHFNLNWIMSAMADYYNLLPLKYKAFILLSYSRVWVIEETLLLGKLKFSILFNSIISWGN